MADIKRNFLYEFNRMLRTSYVNSSAVKSVFEDIDKGEIKISASKISETEVEFVEKVDKCIFMIKKILNDPFKIISGAYVVVPTSEAKKIDREAVRLTVHDTALWTEIDGKRVPKEAYSLINEDVFTNYENAFICQLIKALILHLKKLKINIGRIYNLSDADFVNTSRPEIELYNRISVQINKLGRLSKQRLFLDNSSRNIDLTDVYYTDTLKSDKRYNFCYKFFSSELKSKGNVDISKDFRILYHNYALIQILYGLYKNGYSVNDSNYYVAVSGKIFIDGLSFVKDKSTINILRTKNGIDILKDNKTIHIEFSKSSFVLPEQVDEDCKKRIPAFSMYDDVYFAYLTSNKSNEKVLNIGYNDPQSVVNELIKAL